LNLPRPRRGIARFVALVHRVCHCGLRGSPRRYATPCGCIRPIDCKLTKQARSGRSPRACRVAALATNDSSGIFGAMSSAAQRLMPRGFGIHTPYGMGRRSRAAANEWRPAPWSAQTLCISNPAAAVLSHRPSPWVPLPPPHPWLAATRRPKRHSAARSARPSPDRRPPSRSDHRTARSGR
jgi:hypothetical protein